MAIAETGSIAGAARAMGISPSLASRRVMRLEMALSARLLVRSTRRLQFTTAGTLLLDWVNGTITSFGALREALAADGQAYSGLKRIASNDYLGRRFLSNALVRLRFRFTALSFVVTVASDPLLFLDRGYDLVVHAGAPPTASVIGRKVMSYRRVLCASPASRASRYTTSRSLNCRVMLTINAPSPPDPCARTCSTSSAPASRAPARPASSIPTRSRSVRASTRAG